MATEERLLFTFIFIIITVIFILIAKRFVKEDGTRYVFNIFSVAMLPTSWIVILREQDYEASGWRAIGNFGFTLFEYIEVGFYYFSVILSLLVLYWFVSQIIGVRKHSAVKAKATNKRVSINNKNGELLNFSVVIAAFLIGTLMLNYSIGVTGAPPKYMPFNIAGAIYYFARLILPAIIFYIYFYKNVSSTGSVALLIAIAYIGLVTMSKFQIAALSFPILLSMFEHKRWVMFGLTVALTFLLLHIAPQLRSSFFEIEQGTAILQDRDFIEILFGAYDILGMDGIIILLPDLLARLVSMQNAILAVQVGDLLKVPLIDFMPVIGPLIGSHDSDATYVTHGFRPPAGFATGLDFISGLILVLNHSPVNYGLLCLTMAIFFVYNERVVKHCKIIPDNHKTIVIFALSCMMCFLPPKWWVISVIILIVLNVLYKFSFFRRMWPKNEVRHS